MPRASPVLPRQRLPAPMTMATSTPISRTSRTRSAISGAHLGSMPLPSGDDKASPPNFSKIRWYFRPSIYAPLPVRYLNAWGLKKANLAVGFSDLLFVRLLAQCPADVAPDHNLLTG